MKTLFAVILGLGLAAPAFAGGIEVIDPNLRVSGLMAKSAAAFMTIKNGTDVDDRLVDVISEASVKTEIHTHIMSDDGVMQMRHVPDGLVVPAEGEHLLERGGDHVMFMGLVKPLGDGDTIDLTLVFENAGEVQITVPVNSAN